MNKIQIRDEINKWKGADAMEKMICFECGEMDNYELKEVEREYVGEGYHFSLKVKIPFCKNCGAPIITEELEDEITEKANKKIRESREIIQRDEIVTIISKYDASQKFLSRMLGWGEITLTRYMNSNFTPNIVNSNKLKSIADPYVFNNILEQQVEESNGAILAESAFVKLRNSVNEQIRKVEDENGKIFKIVNWFLSQATEENRITHLALQKLLYFSQAWNYVFNGEWLFKDDCEAWVHGAVYHSVYDEFKKFKYKPLPIVDVTCDLTEKELFVLEFVKRFYCDVYTAKALENICHLEEPYKNARKDCCETDRSVEVIDKQTIQEYYMNISLRYNISRGNPDNVKNYLNELLFNATNMCK